MFKRLHVKIDKIYGLCLASSRANEGKNDLIALLKEENRELREQVKGLMDRFMARNFEQLQVYSERPVEEMNFDVVNPFSDEDLSGMVIGDEVKDEAK